MAIQSKTRTISATDFVGSPWFRKGVKEVLMDRPFNSDPVPRAYELSYEVGRLAAASCVGEGINPKTLLLKGQTKPSPKAIQLFKRIPI